MNECKSSSLSNIVHRLWIYIRVVFLLANGCDNRIVGRIYDGAYIGSRWKHFDRYEKPMLKKNTYRKGHITNKRIEEYVPCEVMISPKCRGYATQTHEWFNGHYRNKSIYYKAQAKICDQCHHYLEQDKKRWLPYRQEHQRRIMAEMGWDRTRWVFEFGMNYL